MDDRLIRCECGSEEFDATIRLRRPFSKRGGVAAPSTYRTVICHDCGKRLDV